MKLKDYAKYRNVNPGTVRYWIKTGRLNNAWARIGRSIEIDPKIADDLLSDPWIQPLQRNPFCEHYSKCLSNVAYTSWGAGKLDCKECPKADIRPIIDLTEMKHEHPNACLALLIEIFFPDTEEGKYAVSNRSRVFYD